MTSKVFRQLAHLKRTYKSCLLPTICITIDCVELLRHFHDQSHFVYITVVDVTTIVYRLLGPASLVCVYVSMSVCLSVCTFVYLFSVSMIVLSTVVSCSIGGQL